MRRPASPRIASLFLGAPLLHTMRRSIDSGVLPGSLVSWDGLHNPRRSALNATAVYVADVLADHSRAIVKSRRPDARQAGTAAHSHGSLPVVR